MTDSADVVLVPGSHGGPTTPWLTYASVAATNRGATVHHAADWHPVREELSDPATAQRWAVERVAPVVAAIESPTAPLLVGKSLGSYAAPVAADRDLPAVWLTPLLTQPLVVAAIRRSSAPCLLVGGTADWAWDGDLARELSDHVCEIPDADHGLFIRSAPLAESAAALGTMATAVEEFLDGVVWPVTG